MSKCSIVRDLLPIYDDRAVSAESASAIRAHLEKCPQCREYHSHINHVTRAMHDKESHNSYRYSGVVKRIRQRNMIELGIAAFVLTAAVIGLLQTAKRY